MDQLPILTLTLNPALDITTTTEKLRPQRKLRCAAPRYDAGGGGVNVSRAISELGGASRAFVMLGGATGEHLLQILDATGIETHVFRSDGDTRFSLTVMEQASGEHFRFVLPGPAQDEATGERLLAAIRAEIGARDGFVVASGTLPPGLPADFYGAIAHEVRAAGARLVLDTSEPALSAAFAARPFCIRVNHLEARDILGGDPVQAAETLARRLVADGTTEIAIITIGDRGAFVATKDHFTHIAPPHVVVRSTVGAGDSFVAALTLGLARGWPVDKAARYGVASAAAAVTTEATELCRRDVVDHLYAGLLGEVA